MFRARVIVIQLLFTAVVGATSLSSVALAETFDKPLQKKVVDLGLSPDFSPSTNVHLKLTCAYYPAFMVKQLEDTSSEGALWFAIVTDHPGHRAPCVQAHGPDEKLIGEDWCGYFSGVKRGVVFLDACDGFSGGIYFAAFDSRSGMKIFEDSVATKNGKIDFVVSDKQITLRYLRVIVGDCSVPKYGSTCWNKFKEQPSLNAAPMPKCSDYKGAEAGVSPSVIAYPVEVFLFPKPNIKALANPRQCWPAD